MEAGGKEARQQPVSGLSLLLPWEGYRKQQKEQVMERASLCSGDVQDLWEDRCTARLSSGM